MTDRSPEPKRLRLSKNELHDMSKEEIVDNWLKQEIYLDILETKAIDGQKENSELVCLRESEEKMKQQQVEATRRENVLVMRLTTKEQEMQEYANQIQELKQAQIPGTTQLRSTLMDPAVNLMFERMKKELELTKAKLEETQNDLSAWKFTPDSNTGKRLMAKCRLLHQENEELGKMISSGRVAKLEGDLALQRNFSEEMKKSQAELDEFLMELDEDVEGMQSTIYYLQQQLRDSKETIVKLQQENQVLRTPPNSTSTGHPHNLPESKASAVGGATTKNPLLPCLTDQQQSLHPVMPETTLSEAVIDNGDDEPDTRTPDLIRLNNTPPLSPPSAQNGSLAQEEEELPVEEQPMNLTAHTVSSTGERFPPSPSSTSCSSHNNVNNQIVSSSQEVISSADENGGSSVVAPDVDSLMLDNEESSFSPHTPPEPPPVKTAAPHDVVDGTNCVDEDTVDHDYNLRTTTSTSGSAVVADSAQQQKMTNAVVNGILEGGTNECKGEHSEG